MSRRFVWFISRSEKEQVEEFDIERCPERRMIDAAKAHPPFVSSEMNTRLSRRVMKQHV